MLALETGGRWCVEALQFVESLAHARVRERPPTMARSAFLAWRRRWSRMVSVSCGERLPRLFWRAQGIWTQ